MGQRGRGGRAGAGRRPVARPRRRALRHERRCRHARSDPRDRTPRSPRASAWPWSRPGNAEVGIWGTVAPHSFYDTFPGFGHHWVAALGPYNEHLVRDYAAAELGFAVLLALAAWWFSRRLVLVAGAAFLAATLPHFAYHLTTTGSFDDRRQRGAASAAFMLELAAVAAAMADREPADTRTEPRWHVSTQPRRKGIIRRLTYRDRTADVRPAAGADTRDRAPQATAGRLRADRRSSIERYSTLRATSGYKHLAMLRVSRS